MELLHSSNIVYNFASVKNKETFQRKEIKTTSFREKKNINLLSNKSYLTVRTKGYTILNGGSFGSGTRTFISGKYFTINNRRISFFTIFAA
jgi:hypothetical protein